MFNSPNAAYYETVATFFDGKEAPTIEVKSELYLEFMHLLSSAYQEFISDIEAADTIGKPAKQVLKDGLSKLPQIIYPINMGNVPRQLQDAEIVSLRMAGSMLAQEEKLSKEDIATISESIARLRDNG